MGSGTITTGPMMSGKILLASSARGLARERDDVYLRSWTSKPTEEVRLATVKVGGMDGHLGQIPVGLDDLQFGQRLWCSDSM